MTLKRVATAVRLVGTEGDLWGGVDAVGDVNRDGFDDAMARHHVPVSGGTAYALHLGGPRGLGAVPIARWLQDPADALPRREAASPAPAASAP